MTEHQQGLDIITKAAYMGHSDMRGRKAVVVWGKHVFLEGSPSLSTQMALENLLTATETIIDKCPELLADIKAVNNVNVAGYLVNGKLLAEGTKKTMALS